MEQLNEDQKRRFDQDMLALNTPSQVMAYVIQTCEFIGSGGKFTNYEWFGLMFRLRQLDLQWREKSEGVQNKVSAATRKVPSLAELDRQRAEKAAVAQQRTPPPVGWTEPMPVDQPVTSGVAADFSEDQEPQELPRLTRPPRS